MPLDITQLKPAQIGTSEIATKNDISQSLIPYADPAALINTNTTTIDGGKITTGSITASQIAATSVTADKLAPTTGNTTIWSGGGLISANFNGNSVGNIGTPTQGFRLSSNAVGTSSDPTIYGAYIKGGTLEGTTLSARDIVVVTDAGYATKSVISSPATLLSSTSSTYNIYDDSYTDATTQRIASTESILYFTGETSYFDIFADEYSTTPFSMSYSGYTILAIHNGWSMTITVNGVSGVLTPPTNGVVTRVINGLTFVSQERTMSGIGSTSYYGVLYIKPINPKPTTMNGQKLSISISGSNGAFRSTSCIVYNI